MERKELQHVNNFKTFADLIFWHFAVFGMSDRMEDWNWFNFGISHYHFEFLHNFAHFALF